MFKKIIAASLAAITLTVAAAGTTAMVVSAAENYKPIVNSNQNYHYCPPGTCRHQYDKAGKVLAMYPMGKWGFVFSNASDHKGSYKYISITPYRIRSNNTYYPMNDWYVNAEGADQVVRCKDAVIDESIAKVTYQGRIYRTSLKSSGILQRFCIGSFRSKCPIK